MTPKAFSFWLLAFGKCSPIQAASGINTAVMVELRVINYSGRPMAKSYEGGLIVDKVQGILQDVYRTQFRRKAPGGTVWMD
jgi:hypothetical protein